MLLSPIQVILLFIFIVLIMILIRNRRFHEQADRLVRQFCQRNGLQFLDGTVSFRGMRFEFRHFYLCRSFRFEYSLDKLDRHHGLLTLCGQHGQLFRVNPVHLTDSKVSNSAHAEHTDLNFPTRDSD